MNHENKYPANGPEKQYQAICFLSEQVRDNRLKLNAIEERLNELNSIARIEENTSKIVDFIKRAEMAIGVSLSYYILLWVYHFVFK